MKWLTIPAITLALAMQGCALTAVSTATLVVTGKSIGDHTLSTVTQHDCDTVNYARGKQDYLCERARELDTTYNRNPY